MQKDKAIGLFMGLFIGDALGAPLEFTKPQGALPTTEMVGGGWLNTAPGEWTDDGAMAMCIASSYLHYKRFYPENIFSNFKSWKNTGKYGTRNYCFDIGRTTAAAIGRATSACPYGGSSDDDDSGNGALMRIAPIIVFNSVSQRRAIAQGTAVSLMTHGSALSVEYVSAFIADVYTGLIRKQDTSRLCKSGLLSKDGSVMYTYAFSHKCVAETSSFEEALVAAVNNGGDADTNGAVTGMLAGAKYGYSNIPQRWLDKLVAKDMLLDVAERLYTLGIEATEKSGHYD